MDDGLMSRDWDKPGTLQKAKPKQIVSHFENKFNALSKPFEMEMIFEPDGIASMT